MRVFVCVCVSVFECVECDCVFECVFVCLSVLNVIVCLCV